MSEPSVSSPAPEPQPLTYASPGTGRASLLRAGGTLGLAGVAVDVLILVVGCFGFSAAFAGFPVAPLLLGVAGLILSLVGSVRRSPEDADTHVLFGLFTNGLAITGAILEIGVWKNWNLWHA